MYRSNFTGSDIRLNSTYSRNLANASVDLGSGTYLYAASNGNSTVITGQSFYFGALSGSGGIFGYGNLTIGAKNTNTTYSGVIASGTGKLVKIGTLTLSGGLTLKSGSTVALSVNNVSPYASDLIELEGSFTTAGTLSLGIVNGDTSFPLGAKVQVFDLTNATSISGSFSAYNLPATADNTSWDTSKLLTDGTIEVVEGSGILSSSYKTFNILPNPAHDYVIVTDDNLSGSFKISFLKLDGGVALETEGVSGEKINISSLNSGAYLVKVVSNDGNVFVSKLLKK